MDKNLDTTIELTSKIVQVAVYPDRARVERRGTADVETQTKQLVIGPLPMSLVAESVRCRGRGTARIRILSVDLRRKHYASAPSETVQALELAIQQLEDELRVSQDQREAVATQKGYLDGLRSETTEYARGLARGRFSVEEQTALMAFLLEQDVALREQSRTIELAERDKKLELEKLRKELKELQSARPKVRMEALVDIEVLEAGSFAVSLSYVVGQARWQPLYDIRLLQENGRRLIELTSIAQVSQNSGEPWTDVALTVSTARPALNQRLPELNPWFIHNYEPPPPVPAAAPQRKMARSRQLMAEAPAEMAAPAPQMAFADAEVASATVNTGESAVSFTLGGRFDIPSDGTPGKAQIGKYELDPTVDYLTIPKHTDAVYRRASVTNKTPGPLLAGSASLFVADEFIGSTQLAYTAVGDSVKLLLGVEEQIKIERELTRRDVDKKLLRDQRQLRYGYRLKIKSMMDEEAKLVIEDHIPVSRHEAIKVKLESATPKATTHSDLNLLKWLMMVPAGAEKTIDYEYIVEHPRSMQLVGLLD